MWFISKYHPALISSFKETLQLLFDIHDLPASLLLCFGAIIKKNKEWLSTSTVIQEQPI